VGHRVWYRLIILPVAHPFLVWPPLFSPHDLLWAALPAAWKITQWVDTASKYVKSVAPKQLLSVGDEGFFCESFLKCPDSTCDCTYGEVAPLCRGTAAHAFACIFGAHPLCAECLLAAPPPFPPFPRLRSHPGVDSVAFTKLSAIDYMGLHMYPCTGLCVYVWNACADGWWSQEGDLQVYTAVFVWPCVPAWASVLGKAARVGSDVDSGPRVCCAGHRQARGAGRVWVPGTS
jgi:hypothetical protein